MTKSTMTACGVIAAIAVPLTTFAFIIFLFSGAYSVPKILFSERANTQASSLALPAGGHVSMSLTHQAAAVQNGLPVIM